MAGEVTTVMDQQLQVGTYTPEMIENGKVNHKV